MGKHSLAQRCLIHADNMDSEGWYTTGNVLREAANKLESHEAVSRELIAEFDGPGGLSIERFMSVYLPRLRNLCA